mgnify:FL=1
MKEGEKSHDGICSHIYCFNPNSNECVPSGYKAYDGTICGNKKWCQNGKCVANDTAPVTSNVLKCF